MNILVCIKQVPDTNEVKIDQKTGTLMREGVPSIINPDDKAGIEVAIQLKEKFGANITVLSMGPPQADVALKEAYAMGADRVILLTDKAFAGSDTWATSLALAYAIKKIEFDIIICGRQAIDGDTAQVGPQIAEHLSIPQVSYVTDIDIPKDALIMSTPAHILVKKQFEDFYQTLKINTPCLLTVLREMNKPRYMVTSRVFDVCKNEIVEKMNITDIELEPERTGLKASPTQVKKVITKSAKAAGKVHELDPKEAAQLIIEKLAEKYVI